MVLATGFPQATYDGFLPPEVGTGTGTLSSKDTHFGLNGAFTLPPCDTAEQGAEMEKYKTFGPRIIDKVFRGGDIAESLWDEFKKNPDDKSNAALSGFLSFFDDFSGSQEVKEGKTNYPEKARIDGMDYGGRPKYKEAGEGKTMANISPEGGIFSSQLGTRWSKIAIEKTIHNGGTVHFHLDGMGNLYNLIHKRAIHNHSHSVTTRELRYIIRNYFRKTKLPKGVTQFWHCVKFYNGYDEYRQPIEVDLSACWL